MNHTPNGFDPSWIEAINGVLEDRESDVRIKDLDDVIWERWVGPLVDTIEDGHFPSDLYASYRIRGEAKQISEPHPKVLHGKCPVCGHYGSDCEGQS